jgi:hypothetical protein
MPLLMLAPIPSVKHLGLFLCLVLELHWASVAGCANESKSLAQRDRLSRPSDPLPLFRQGFFIGRIVGQSWMKGLNPTERGLPMILSR